MRLQVIGCSPAWPNPGGAHSGYLVEGAAGRLLLDCGPGVLARLRQLESWPDLDAVAITHFHLDHWGDLVPWVWGAMYHKAGHGRPVVWVHAGGRARLREFGAGLGSPEMFEHIFDVQEYHADQPFTAGGFEVTPRRLPHYTLETYGFRVSANGTTLAYSGDSGPSDQLADLARGADLFLCEATLRHGDDDGQPRGHLSLDEALAATRAAGNPPLIVTHRPSELEMPDGIAFARDGLELEIP